jgi:acyl-[acyl-carrier-protein]-phospholipid O-acyltransferase/long-chain-fatty-acid--[acyl-carrier-protein] ligase
MNAESITTCNVESLGKADSFRGNVKRIFSADAAAMDHKQPTSPTAADRLTDVPAEDRRQGLLSPSFIGLLITQFLGATNDNIFRWLVAWIGGDYAAKDPIFRWLVSWVNPNLPAKGYADIAVSMGLAMLVLPFILLAAPAGYFADRFSKRNVIVACKVAEVLLMILGAVVILYGNVWLMFFTLFLMGGHSAIFGPSKYGSIPEIVRPDRLSAANGLIGMTTILAIVLGNVTAGLLYDATVPSGTKHWWLWAATIVGVAATGLMTSLPIRRLRVANPARKFVLNFAGETYSDLKALAAIRPLFLVAAASTLFWSLGGLCQINVNNFSAVHLNLANNKTFISVLLGVLAVGVGTGCVLAGAVSRRKILLSLVPLGAAGMAIAHILLFFVPGADGNPNSVGYYSAAACLLLLGLAGGMYDVPLQAYLQHNSPEKSRGAIFAATNLMTFTGTIIATAVYILLVSVLGLSGRTIFLLVGILLLFWVVAMVRFTAYDTTRMLVVGLWKLMYRTRIEGLENIPATGALITPNHVSYADGLLVGLSCPRDPRMLVFADFFETPWLRWFGRLGKVILIHPGRKSIVESLRTAREALVNGELVCVFPEGGITRSGELQPFQPGLMRIIEGADMPVIPVYIDGMWGSIFSFKGGKAIWKLPEKLRRPVTVRFGKPIYHPTDIDQIRRAVVELGEIKNG